MNIVYSSGIACGICMEKEAERNTEAMEEKELFEEQKDESEIELHPEIAKQRQDTYNSLTDLNGIDVFSTEFRNAVKKVMEERAKELKELEEQVFDEGMIQQKRADTELTDKLFTGQQETILRHDYTKDTKGLSVVDIGMVLIAMLAVCGIYIFFFQDKKARKKRL
ncbi:MAG: hypothetical protein Q4D94_10660 [Bacillota bacterium]|nr:hypothetical protein [Bacillota bacterium]